MLVKHKVAWPHEAILGGGGREQNENYMRPADHITMGFCRNILDE